MNHVVPLELTDDERSQAEDDAVDRGKPSQTWGSLVLTSNQGKAGRALIQGLRPTWSRRGENPRLIPPSRGRPYSWDLMASCGSASRQRPSGDKLKTHNTW